MSRISIENSKNLNQEMHEQLKRYMTKIEKSLKETTEKLKIKEIENSTLKSEYEKISFTCDNLSAKLSFTETKMSFLDKQLEMYEKHKDRNGFTTGFTNGFTDYTGLQNTNNQLCGEISSLSKELKLEQKKNLEFEKQLDKYKKEIEEFHKNKFSSSESLEDERKYFLTQRKGSLQSISDRKDSIQSMSERRFSLQKEFLGVIENARIKRKADSINKTSGVEKEFVDMVIDLAMESIDKSFKNYSEISDYMRNKIREKYGHLYLVTVGKYDYYNSSSWSITSRKTLSFKISDLGFAMFQIHTECYDLVNTAKWVTNVEIISKNEFTDSEFEKFVSIIALESIGKNFTGYEQISEFMSSSISKRFGKRWFVATGVYDNYDLSLNISLTNKRKFIELLIKDLRFTIFQAI